MKKNSKLIMFLLIIFITNINVFSQDIFEYVKKNKFEKVKELIENNLDLLKSRDKIKRTPLHWACRKTHLLIFNYLIKKGSDINVFDISGHTPLHLAAARNYPELLKILIDEGADVNIKNVEGFTALHHASYRGYSMVSNKLIKGGTKINLKDNWNRTCLQLAIDGAHFVVNQTKKRQNDYYKTVEALLNTGIDKENRDVHGDSALLLGIIYGRKELINLMLINGAKFDIPKDRENEMFHFAATYRMEKIVNRLIKKGVNLYSLNNDGGTVIHSASLGGNVKLIEDMLKRGFKINQKDRYGFTPIHKACEKGNLDMLIFLIKNGAEKNSRSISGETPLSIAKKKKHKKVIKYLTNINADGNNKFPVLKGKYLGQKTPGLKAELFGVGIVSDENSQHSPPIFTNDLKEM